MDSILRAVDSSVILLIITVLLAVLLMLSIIKQFVKLVILLLLLASLYGVYLYISGQNIPKDGEGLLKQGKEQVEMLKQTGGKFLDALDEEKKEENSE